MRRLIGITHITNTFNQCYTSLDISTIYNEQTKTTTLPIKMPNVKYAIRTASVNSEENNGMLEKIKFKGVEELEMNNNITNPHINNALIYMGDLNENNIPIKTSNAMEAIVAYFNQEYEDINTKQEVYKKLSKLGVCSKKECDKLSETVNKIHNYEGRHYKNGHSKKPMENKKMVSLLNEILKYICTS